jgi:hypothetical protein
LVATERLLPSSRVGVPVVAAVAAGALKATPWTLPRKPKARMPVTFRVKLVAKEVPAGTTSIVEFWALAGMTPALDNVSISK